MSKIATLCSDYEELMLDLDIYGTIISEPQLSIAEMKELLYADYHRTRHISLEDKRYRLSDIVSVQDHVNYINELKLCEDEEEIDFDSCSESIVIENTRVSDESLSLLRSELDGLETLSEDASRQAQTSFGTTTVAESSDDEEDWETFSTDDSIGSIANEVKSSIEQEGTDEVEETNEDWGTSVSTDSFEDEDELEDDSDDEAEDEDAWETDYEDDWGTANNSVLNDTDECHVDKVISEPSPKSLHDNITDPTHSVKLLSQRQVKNNSSSVKSAQGKHNINTKLDKTLKSSEVPVAPIVKPVVRNEPAIKEDTSPSREDVPKDLREFLRKYPHSDVSFVLKYFTKKEVQKALMTGKIIKKGTKLHI